jgi:hypothetical protein
MLAQRFGQGHARTMGPGTPGREGVDGGRCTVIMTRPDTDRPAQPVRPDTGRPPCRVRAWQWLGRYAPAEAAAILGAVLAAGAVDLFASAAATALAGAIGETVAFYAVIVIRDLRRRPGHPGRRVTRRTLRNLLLEFGPAELLDTAVVRPLAMYAGVILVGNALAGVVLGKIAADVVFYTLAIIGYEISKSLAVSPTAAAASHPVWPNVAERDDPLAPGALDRLPFVTPYHAGSPPCGARLSGSGRCVASRRDVLRDEMQPRPSGAGHTAPAGLPARGGVVSGAGTARSDRG